MTFFYYILQEYWCRSLTVNEIWVERITPNVTAVETVHFYGRIDEKIVTFSKMSRNFFWDKYRTRAAVDIGSFPLFLIIFYII